MSSNPRRSGFRLPWLSDASDEESTDPNEESTDPNAASTDPNAASSEPAAAATGPNAASEAAPADQAEPVEASQRDETAADVAMRKPTEESGPGARLEPAAAPPADPSNPFLVSLISAMRGVVDEARASNSSQLESQLEARVAEIRIESSARMDELRQAAEREIAAIGDWSTAEMERIRREAAQRVEARRRQLEQQLAAQNEQTEREIVAVRQRISEYESEMSAFLAQLSEITDPAAFVAAAKRVPPAPQLTGSAAGDETGSGPGQPQPTVEALPAAPPATEPAAKPSSAAETQGEATGSAVATSVAADKPEAEPASSPAVEKPESAAAEGAEAEAASTEKTTAIVVKGLGSFGAITSFKQSLEGADGVGAVSLSLGPTGEFVYRATHEGSVDLTATIARIETGAEVEQQPDGSLRVTVHRGR